MVTLSHVIRPVTDADVTPSNDRKQRQSQPKVTHKKLPQDLLGATCGSFWESESELTSDRFSPWCRRSPLP